LRSNTPRRFRPGELAPVTGIYLVRHNRQHRPTHEAVIVRGEQLPSCRTCQSHISYEVLRVASHITHDWDFSAPHFNAQPNDFANVRRSLRFNVQLPVLVQINRPSGKGTLQGMTQNLSECGLSAVLEGKLGQSQKSVAITLTTDAGKPCVLRARLRYRNGLHHGFEFVRTSSVQKTALRLAMKAAAGE